MRGYQYFFLPLALLVGTVIGAGVFSLPFLFQRVGLGLGILLLAAAGISYAVVHLLYADVVLITRVEYRLAGYVRKYLGAQASLLAVLTSIVGMIFSLTIYLILSVSFILLALPDVSPQIVVLLFWALGSIAIFFRVKRLAFAEFVMSAAILSIITALFVFALPGFSAISPEEFLPRFHGGLLFPLGAMLFSLSGRVAIPTIVKYFRVSRDAHDYQGIRRVILWGTIVPSIAYLAFIFAIIGLSGIASEDAVSGLRGVVPSYGLAVISVLGLLSIFSSYITIGLDTMMSLHHDFQIAPFLRIFIVVGGPLLLYLIGLQQFVELVAFAGGVFLAVEGILIMAMWRKAHRDAGRKPVIAKNIPGALISFAFIVFAAALAGQIFNYLL